MRIIRKKTWPDLFEAVRKGEKRFDLRLNEFEVEKGDTLILEEWDPVTDKYTGRILETVAGHVMKFEPKDPVFWSEREVEEKGIVIISLTDIKE